MSGCSPGRTAETSSYTFALVTSLFLLWGFCNGMIDILNKHFQDSLHINKEQSGLVQFANYLAYFLMAIPAGLIARKFGYKGGILVGLVVDCRRRVLVHSAPSASAHIGRFCWVCSSSPPA